MRNKIYPQRSVEKYWNKIDILNICFQSIRGNKNKKRKGVESWALFLKPKRVI
jgi:hypothetical protein